MKRVLFFYSGKGGVGKSTVGCNCAFALADNGYKVGILDADFNTPSVHRLIAGVKCHKKARIEKMRVYPAVYDNILLQSSGFFNNNTGIIWNEDYIDGALFQLLDNELWDVDFLIVDNDIPTITSYTLMGMGEPLLNFDNVVKFYDKGIKKPGLKHMSLSTVGIADKIVHLADSPSANYELFVSLHSPFDEQRNIIMPINKKYNIEQVVKASRHYVNIKNMKANMSYLLLDGVNDSVEHVQQLARVLDTENFIVQLLLYNPHRTSKYKRPDESKALAIKDMLQNKGYQVNIIVSKAKDIAGGCGQLAGEL